MILMKPLDETVRKKLYKFFYTSDGVNFHISRYWQYYAEEITYNLDYFSICITGIRENGFNTTIHVSPKKKKKLLKTLSLLKEIWNDTNNNSREIRDKILMTCKRKIEMLEDFS